MAKKRSRYPAKFHGTITEKDRQSAESFSSTCNCLIATMLKRMGFRKVTERCNRVFVDGRLYLHREMGWSELHDIFENSRRPHDAAKKPFYTPEIVGTRITFTKVTGARRTEIMKENGDVDDS